MRICFLIDNNLSNMGGEQRVLTKIVNSLVLYYEIDLFCKYDENRGLFYPVDGKINVINMKECPKTKSSNILLRSLRWLNYRTAILDKLKLKSIMKNVKYPLPLAKSWINLLNSKNYDSIIGVSGFFGMFLMLFGKKLNAKCYTWFHNTYEAYFSSPKKYLFGYESLLEYAGENIEKLIVLTESDMNKYRSLYNLPVSYIYNPLSFETEKKTDYSNNRLIFVGRIVKKQKGIDYLIEILDNIFTENTEWSIVIVGDGEDMQYLRQSILLHKWSDRVEFIGNSNNVVEYYLNSSIALLTSRWEGFGLVVTEAMECGLPVVSFDTSGPKEIISNDVNGYLIKDFNTNEFSKKVLSIMNNKEKMKKLGENAIHRAKDYSINKIIESWCDMLG